MRTQGSTNLPGANWHGRSPPEGRGPWMARVHSPWGRHLLNDKNHKYIHIKVSPRGINVARIKAKKER
jgi:hypothetical protein